MITNDNNDPNNARDMLSNLHTAVAEELLARVKSGNASAAELTVAAKFLKDNHIECVPTADNALGKLVSSIPEFDQDSWNEQETGHS